MIQTGDESTYLSVVFIDVLIVGHLHQAVAQVVVGEDEETGLQVTVDFFQVLKKKKKRNAERSKGRVRYFSIL